LSDWQPEQLITIAADKTVNSRHFMDIVLLLDRELVHATTTCLPLHILMFWVTCPTSEVLSGIASNTSVQKHKVSLAFVSRRYGIVLL